MLVASNCQWRRSGSLGGCTHTQTSVPPTFLPSAGSRDFAHDGVPRFSWGFPTRFLIARPLAVRFSPKVRLWYPHYDYHWIPSQSLHIQISCASHLNHLIGFALLLILRPSTKDIIRIRSCTVSTHRHAAGEFFATSLFDHWTLYTSPRPTLAYPLNSNLGPSCAVVTYTYVPHSKHWNGHLVRPHGSMYTTHRRNL